MASMMPTGRRQDMAHRTIGDPKRALAAFGETITKPAWWSRLLLEHHSHFITGDTFHGTR